MAVSTTTTVGAITGAMLMWGYSQWDPHMEDDDWEIPDTLQTLPVYVREQSGFDIQTYCNHAVKLRNAPLSHADAGD